MDDSRDTQNVMVQSKHKPDSGGDASANGSPTIEQQRNYLRQMRQGHQRAEVRRRAELARLDYEQNLPLLNSLLEIGYEFRRPQPTSGLIAWHRLMTQFANSRQTKSSRR